MFKRKALESLLQKVLQVYRRCISAIPKGRNGTGKIEIQANLYASIYSGGIQLNYFIKEMMTMRGGIDYDTTIRQSLL